MFALGGLAFACEGVERELPEDDLARLRSMAVGTRVILGVDPATFVRYPNSPDNSGFVPPEDRLFSSYSPMRPSELKVTVTTRVRILPYKEAAVVYEGYLLGGGFALQWRDLVLAGEALWRFGGDDLEVDGRTVHGGIEHGNWGFRLSLGYGF